MTPREWNTAVGTGLLRIAAGAALLRWRRPLAQRFAGVGPDDSLVPLLFGYFGVRDITVGVITLAATHPNGDVPGKVALQGMADTTDAALIAAVTARGRLPRDRGIAGIVLAAVTALAEFATAWDLKRRR